MGTGEFVCVSMTGGAPWGFRLQGGREQKQPLRVAKVGSPERLPPLRWGRGGGGGGAKQPVCGWRGFPSLWISSVLVLSLDFA